MSHRIVFIDSHIADHQSLMAQLPENTEAVLLDAERDGIEQILSALFQTKPNQTKPNQTTNSLFCDRHHHAQTKPNQTKPNQTNTLQLISSRTARPEPSRSVRVY